MSKIIVVEVLNYYNGFNNYEIYEAFNDKELKEILSSYDKDDIKLKVYEGKDKLEYFKNEIAFLQRYNNSDTHYLLFNDIDEFKEYRSEVFMNMFNDNDGFIYNEIDHLIDDLKSERDLIDYVELEASNDMFLYYEKSGSNEYELMNNVLRIDDDLTLNEFNHFIKHSKR